MIWSDLRKCEIEDVVGYINEKIEEHGSLMKVAEHLGINESTIRKHINNRGYKRFGSGFVPLDDTCNHREHTPKKEKMTTENTDVINLPDLKENMMYLSSETETLKDMIKWFKSKDDRSNTDVIELVEGVKIDLPEAPIKRTTIRINEKVWDMFNELVEENKPIDKHDIMSMALLEYINKYKK
ncbi:hypothetical protein [Paraclostridium bifermentans]|uniref:hypothetical protein n=1 Tax=Paraclostridium bifermentans TaxID=1490 RepID=UPI0011DC77C6|nr:hypothetical protein [Paraclostridium bifermentans]